MADDTAPAFEREQGYTDEDWQRCLPGAVGGHTLTLPGPGQALVTLAGGGQLHLTWTVLPPRRIALLCIPRLQVHYRFDSVPAEERLAFLRSFDRYMLRGGG